MEILIIQILRMGDALQLIPLVKGIKALFPESKISLLTSALGAAILEPQPEVDAVFVLEKAEIAQLLESGTQEDALDAVDRLAKNLAPVLAKHWDWTINFSYTFATAQISFLLNSKHHSGFTANQHRQYVSKEKWFAYSMASFVNRRYSVYNWVDINRHILGLKALPQPPAVEVSPKLHQQALNHLKHNNIEAQALVAFIPGASGNHKRWPAEKFGRLGQALVEKHGKSILILGDKTERSLGVEIQKAVGKNVLNLAGLTDLNQLKAYLGLCEAVVTNDTGPMHLAAALGIPTVGLFFSTHFVETGPYGAEHMVLHPALDCFPCQNTAACDHKKCLNHIAPETVEKLLIGGKKLIDCGQNFLGPDDGLVKTYFSDFDPWGNLEWRPVEKRPVSFDALQRLFLKIVWLYYAGVMEDLNGEAQDYISRTLSRYEKNGEVLAQLDDYIEKAAALDGVLKAGQATALEIQQALLADEIDVARVNQLGDVLGEKEAQIEKISGRSSLNFIRELTVVLQENIEKTTPLDLATKTIGVYRDVRAFTAGLIRQAEAVKAMLAAG